MKILLLSAPYDSGHYKKRLGAGPLVLCEALHSKLKKDGHQVRKEEIHLGADFFTEVTTSFEVSRSIAQHVKFAKANNEFSIVFTGNCNTAAIGTLSGLEDDLGVIWFDCHGDFNTPETTIGGFLDGMALSMVTGACWPQLTESVPGFKAVPERNVILTGVRDLDPLEEQRLKASDVTLITPEILTQKNYDFGNSGLNMQSVYLHIDLDVLDPEYAKVNSYNKPGGIFPETLYETILDIKKSFTISGIGFSSYDPSTDPDGKVGKVVCNLVERIIE